MPVEQPERERERESTDVRKSLERKRDYKDETVWGPAKTFRPSQSLKRKVFVNRTHYKYV